MNPKNFVLHGAMFFNVFKALAFSDTAEKIIHHKVTSINSCY